MYMHKNVHVPGVLHVGPLNASVHLQVSFSTQTPFSHGGSHITAWSERRDVIFNII